jgi:radical SAM superfamily enzyme YgiQ (UPF0313 family)
MKIALIYPATEFDNIYHKYALPYGLLSLTAVVEGNGIGSVDIFDSRHMSAVPGTEDLNKYDVIGFTAMSMQVTHALDMAKEIRRSGYTGQIVFGGPHASVAPDHLKSEEVVDGIFIGESEETFLQYLQRLAGKPHTLQRVWLRDGSRNWIYFEGNDFIHDLDSLPFPAREKYESVVRETLFINITTTRGCPYQCNYCQPSKQILFGKKIRRRTIDNILKEIREYMDAYAITSFSIDDDTFTFNESVVTEFCEKVKPLKLSWTCQTRTDIKPSTLYLMKEAGCTSLFVGVESGSQRMLNLMEKHNTVENNEQFLKACKDVGISTWCNMMVGYPGETIEDMSESLRFLRRTLPERVSVSQVTPFPGTKVWSANIDDLIQLGWDDVARHIRKPKFRSMARLQAPIDDYTLFSWRRNSTESCSGVTFRSTGFLPEP